ncbi:MAG: hypothetical protein ACQR33_04700 [Candidatus Saccharibacteria bacterium]
MRRVFLAGTTTGTTWRAELTERLIARGVQQGQIVNPHLPRGVKYTSEHMRLERECKQDPHTIVLIFICPAVVDAKPHPVPAAYREELLGPISMFEIGKFAYSQPERTAVVLDSESFTQGNRPRSVLEGLALEISQDFDGQPPFFASLTHAEDWLVAQLA